LPCAIKNIATQEGIQEQVFINGLVKKILMYFLSLTT
jgi:hypothetical protein